MSVLEQVIPTAFTVDWVLAGAKTTGPGARVAEVLRRFWEQPDLRDIASHLDLPGDEWSRVFERLFALARGGRPPAPPAFWFEIVRRSATLREEDPVAALIVTLYAVAAWEGAFGKNLYLQPWGAPHREWRLFPLQLARNLSAVGAIWGARLVAKMGREFIEATKEAYFDAEMQETIASYRAVEIEVEATYGDAVRTLAGDLSKSCVPNDANFRPEVAAMLWSLGHVPEANLLGAAGSSEYVPSVKTCERLVDQSMRRIPSDPFLQYLWLEIKDRPPFNIRDHDSLFGRVNHRYGHHLLHQLDASFGADALMRRYARALIAYFRGDTDAYTAADTPGTFLNFGDMLRPADPASYARLFALANLGHPNPSDRADNWKTLAAYSASILEEAQRAGAYVAFDNILDIPFHYLPGNTPTDVEAALAAVERYRTGGLWYWLTVAPPALGIDNTLPPALQTEEERILSELRGARFIRLIPNLPSHYQRYGYSMNERFATRSPGAAAGGAAAGGAEGGGAGTPADAVYENPLDQTVAQRQLLGLGKELRAFHQQIAQDYPAYSAARLDPCATIDAFAAALPAAPLASKQRRPRPRRPRDSKPTSRTPD